jgi:hypothetical protein
MPKSLSSCWTSIIPSIASNSLFEEGKGCTMAIHCWTIPWSLCCLWHQCLLSSKKSAPRMTSHLQVPDWNTSAFCWSTFWCNPPRNVSYKRTFGVPDQGQTLDMWESPTTESALRWQMHHIMPHHILEPTLEVILDHVLGIITMTWIFNPGSWSKSLSLPRN